jgi:hypothetical protein
MKRLNGWQRIGIIASVIWMLTGPVLTIKADSDEYDRQTGYGLDRCWKTADQAREQRFRSLDARHLPLGDELEAARKAVQDLMDQEYHGCADKVWANNPHPGLANAIAIPLITLGIAWLLVYFLVGLGRWVMAGFKKGGGAA